MTNPAIASQYIAEDMDAKNWRQVLTKIDELASAPEKWDYAAAGLLSGYATDRTKRKDLIRFVKQNRDILSQSEQAWGEAGYALVNHDLTQMVQAHFAGWRDRPNIKPWMLTNLACAYMNDDQLREAAELSDYCLGLPPDHSFPMHITNLAHCEANVGDPAQALALLEQIVLEAETPGTQFEYELARAAATARAHGGARLSRAWNAIKNARRYHPQYKLEPGSKKSYQRTVKTVGAQGGMLGKLRAWFHLLQQ